MRIPDTLSPTPRTLGRYAVLRELTRDRYSVAYLALDPVLNREVVLKAVEVHAPQGPDTAAHEELERAFARQAQCAGRLHHPHIVTVHDAGRIKNIGYLAIERVGGRLLSDLLIDGFKPGFLQAADLAARVADAVDFAHARGIAHGRLSACDITVQPDRQPKVTGFGGWIDGGERGDGALAGTEQALPYYGDSLDDALCREDVRALGGLLYLLLTGQRPERRRLRLVRAGADSPIRLARPDTPVALADIAEDALELRGTRPYTSAAQVRNALTAFLYGTRTIASGPPTSIGSVPESARACDDAPPAVATRPARRRTALPAFGGVLQRHRAALLVCTVPALVALAWGIQVWRAGGAALDAQAADLGRAPPQAASVPAGDPARPLAPSVAAPPAPPSPPAPAVAAPVATGAALEARMPSEPASAPGTTGAASAAAPAAANALPAAMPAAARPRAADRRPARTMPAEVIGTGTVSFAIVPWGEVIVDGASRGITPPLTQLPLPAGRHTIEVRNGNAPPHIVTLDVSADSTTRVGHRFP